MPRFRIHEEVAVTIVSEPIEADLSLEAFALYMAKSNHQALLRNITGNRLIKSVEFEGRRLKARIQLLDENDQPLGDLMNLTADDLEQL